MSRNATWLTPTALSLSFFATTAIADITAPDVWGDWRAYIESMGYVVTATESPSGNILRVDDITVEITNGPNIEKMTLHLGSFEFLETGDGTVEVMMPAVTPIALDVTPKSSIEKPAHIAFDFTQSGQRMIVSGDASEMEYSYTADTFGVNLTELEVDGEKFDQTAAQFALVGNAVKSLTKVTGDELRSYVQDLSIGNISYNLLFKSPDGVEAMQMDNRYQDLAFTSTSTLPQNSDTLAGNITPFISAGFAFNGELSTQENETKMEIVSAEGTTKVKSNAANSSLLMDMSADGIRYLASTQQVQMGAEIAGLPFPLFAEMENAGFEFRTPLLKSDDPQDFKLAFDMTDFTMSDIIWALFDPSEQLPRDAATIALDLSGKAKVLFDLFDTEKLEQLAQSGTIPGEVSELKIDRMTIDAVGAQINATGDVTFDNTDKITLPGFPKPVGDINIDVAGANGLMDKLVAMGLLPSEQVMGARMMMGMFTVAGDTPDTLKSKIEFTQEGQVLANGQRLK